MADDEGCKCFKCVMTRAVDGYIAHMFPDDMPHRPSQDEILGAIVGVLGYFAQDVAVRIDNPMVARAGLDTALARLLKYRMSITDVPTIVDLDTGAEMPVSDFLETKH
jgi:hypothetical protein